MFLNIKRFNWSVILRKLPISENLDKIGWTFAWFCYSQYTPLCDIYCAHAYLCRCHSSLFCFRKLKPRRFIFLINCRSNLTINIVGKMRNEWLTMPTLTKENVFFFDSQLSPGYRSLLLKELKLMHIIETKEVGKEIS